MKAHIIETGKFKLDGGAMFGVVPKQMWNRLNPADENNMCTWSMRCLLVDVGERVILFDTGMGDKQDEKFASHFEPHGEDNLISSITNAGYTREEITDVFLTHLHFDHCGGAVSKLENGDLIPTFPNAMYWTGRRHLASALDPNPREKASFLKENIVPLETHGKLSFIEEDQKNWTDSITVKFYDGHTAGMMIPTITFPNGNQLTFAADLLPSSYHVRMPYVMSYDIDPLQTLEDKKAYYEEALAPNHYVLFEHDPVHLVGSVIKNEKGRYAIEKADFNTIIGAM